MQQRALKAIIVALALSLGAGSYPLVSDQVARHAYVNALAGRVAHHIEPKFVLVGDSITADGGPWGVRLSYNPLAAVTFAQPGSTSTALAPITDPSWWRCRPKYALLMAGTNDVRTPDVTARAFAQTQVRNVDRMLSSGAQVVVTLIPPMSDEARNARIASFNSAFKASLGARKVLLIDLSPDLAPKGRLLPDYTTDGIHFTEAAYRIWARRLREATRS